MQQVSFGGIYIKPITIKKRSFGDEFVPHEISLVQFDSKNKTDVDAIQRTLEKWSIFDNCFVEIIRDVAHWLHISQNQRKSHKIFFLTNQQYGFEKLNPSDILGEFMIWKPKNSSKVEIEVLQANPFHNYDVGEHRQYAEIGQAMLDEIKEQCAGKILKLRSDKYATGFYEKNGFIPNEPGSLDYTYTP